MKLPNFRLYDTQATTSMFTSLLGVVLLLGLSFLVFHGLNTDQQWVVPYNPEGRMGRYRPTLIMLFTAVAVLTGITAGLLGFRSLGQSRNTKQGFSWMGMLIGALVLSMAPVLFYAWRTLSEPMIIKRAVDL
jgi:hypothetical protein